MNPEVSVIIPTYNSEEYLAQALKSVFNQSYRNFEVIVIDDASEDSTVQIAHSFRDRRLKIIENSFNRGVSYGRNRGISQAKGKWIALLDSDDWYAPRRIEKLLAIAQEREADLIADDLYLIADGEQHHWSTLLAENALQESSPIVSIDAVKFVVSDRLSPIGTKRTWSLGYVKPLIRREFLLDNNIRYDENINVGEDFTLYLECLRRQGRFYLVTQPYYYYRTRVTSLSTRKPTEFLSQSCEITQKFIAREVRSKTESPLLQVLLQNLIIFQKRLAYYRLLESLQDKKLKEAIEEIIINPHVLVEVGKKIIEVLKGKLSKVLKSDNSDRVIYSPTKRETAYSNREEWFQPYVK